MSSCINTTPSIPSTEPTETWEYTISPSQTQTIKPTSTPIKNYVTPTVTPHFPIAITETASPSPTFSSGALGELICLEIKNSLPVNSKESGSLMVEDYDTHQVFVINISTGKQIELFDEENKLTYFEPSPDGKWISVLWYLGEGKEKLILLNSNGERVNIIDLGDKWALDRWVDNKRLIFHYFDLDDNDHHIRKFYIVDPFSGEWSELIPPKNLVTLIDSFIDTSMVSYDPSLQYIVYPKEGYLTVLEKLSTGETITQFYTFPGTVPKWAPDGQSFIIVENEKPYDNPTLIQVSLQGKIEVLITPPVNASIEQSAYYWSPDGKYIALWYKPNIDNRHEISLVLYNIETHELVNYCFFDRLTSAAAKQIYWSQDSRFIAIILPDFSDQSLGQYNTVIVDIVDHWAAQVVDNAFTLGWVDSN